MALVIGIFAIAFAIVWLCNRNRKNGRAGGKGGKAVEMMSSSRRRPKDVEADAGRKERSARDKRDDSDDGRGDKSDSDDDDDSDDSESSDDEDGRRQEVSKARSQQNAAASRKLQEEREATMRAQQAREAQERARQQQRQQQHQQQQQQQRQQQPPRAGNADKSKKNDESSSDDSDSDDSSDGDSDSDDSDDSDSDSSDGSSSEDDNGRTPPASAAGRRAQVQAVSLNGSPVQAPKPTRQLYPANASPEYIDQHTRPNQPQQRSGSTSSSSRAGVPPAGPPPSGSLPRVPIPSAMRQSAYGGASSAHRQSMASVRVGGSLPSSRAPPMPGMQARPRMASEGGAGSTRPLNVRKSIASNHPGRTSTEPMPRRPSQGQRTPAVSARTDHDLPPVPPLNYPEGDAAYGGMSGVGAGDRRPSAASASSGRSKKPRAPRGDMI